MDGWLKIFALGIVLAFCSCTTPQTFAPDKAPEYVTIRDFTPFYRVGPMQPRPDASLPSNTRFKVLRQEMGYSFVQLEDNRTGYVANENMALAPPKPKVDNDYMVSDNTPAGRKKRGNTSAVYQGEQMNDIPLPNAPPPDLNIAPEEVPSAPAPTPTPQQEKPKFRF